MEPEGDLGVRRPLECTHADMGLRLANAFAAAGLPPPLVQTDLRMVYGTDFAGYAFFEHAIRDLLPTLEDCALARAADLNVDTFAERLKRETTLAAGHIFLPLQVGAWARVRLSSG